MTRQAWLLVAIALAGCKRNANPSPADPIVGCYSVTESRDPRYARGDRLCMLKGGIALHSNGSLGEDAFDVEWTATGNDFRAVVPPAQTGGGRVEFSVKRLADGKLDFTAAQAQAWMTVRLEGSGQLEGNEMLERLAACRQCIAEAASAGGKDAVPQTPIYSLRSCTMFLRVTHAPCSALGVKGP